VAMEIRRPLKRAMPKLGPPDIYPQDPKQKEDELTSVNVKQGYTSFPLLSSPNTLDEFGTAKNANIDAFGVYFSALLSEKHRINTLKDTQKKKQLVNTKEIWYVHAKTKHAVDNWFRDLANGTKSLGQLGKRIPIFNSKEGMFSQLYESHVPLAKAVWFIKMSAVHAVALSESSSKSKKRQVPDQYQELTAALTKYLKEISIRMSEFYQQSQQHVQQVQQQQQQQIAPQQQPGSTNPSSGAFTGSQSLLQRNTIKQTPPTMSSSKLSPTPVGSGFHQHLQNSLAESYTSSLLNHQPNFTANIHTSVATLMTSHTASAASLSATSMTSLPILHEDFTPTYNQWQYQTQLARYLFDEGLLDQYDFLCFLLELFEKKRPINDLVVRVICPLILEYVIDFSRSAVLSRRLAHVCAKKLGQALHHHPLTGRPARKHELAQQQQLQQQSSNNNNPLVNFGLTDNFMARHSLINTNSTSKYNQFDSRISDTQSSSLLRNSSSSANNNHLTANSILDIVKAQIIESQHNFVEGFSADQENSENNLYKNAIYILSSIIQVICIECPTAMVRHHIIDAKFPPVFQGSPLDHLPCLPSNLPMMESDLNFELRKSIHDAEREILHRSAMVDSKWSCDSSNRFKNSKGGLVNRLLTVMDILDKHNFDKIDSINSIDLLYSKIFPSTDSNLSSKSLSSQTIQPSPEASNNPTSNSGILDLSSTSAIFSHSTSSDHSKKNKHQQAAHHSGNSQQDHVNEQISNQNYYEEDVIKLLCEWATTTQRTGEYRALVVARLLEKRQFDYQSSEAEAIRNSSNKTRKAEDSKSQSNTNMIFIDGSANSKGSDQAQSESNNDQQDVTQFLFQNLLVQFLDENAPVIEDTQEDSVDNRKAFKNLVLLFSELIRCDIFSHYNYMCTLISRGMFNDLTKSSIISTEAHSVDSPAPNSNLNQPGSVKQPHSIKNESDTILTNAIQGLTGGPNIYPLTVSTTNNDQSVHLDPLSSNKLGLNADQSLRSLGFSPVSSQQNVSQNQDKGHGLLDNHIDDVDADLGKILQDIKEGQQDEAADILLPDYLGGSLREEASSKNQQINKLSPFGMSDRPANLEQSGQTSSNVMSTNNFAQNAVESKLMGACPAVDEKATKNPNEHRHLTYVKHFPVPDDENFAQDINQRNFLLYGFGKEREEMRHGMKKLIKDLSKLFHRRASRDINDGGKIKKLAFRDGFNPEITMNKFEALNHHDQHIITNSLSITVLEMFTGVSNGQTFSLPTLESLSFVFDLFTIASNVSGFLELVIPILEELPDIEAQIKLKCPLLANQYTHSIALCIIGMLYRYHSCALLLSRDELFSIFDSLHKLVSHVSSPGICTTSAERVIFYYLYDLYSAQTGRTFDQFSGLIQRIKQALQHTPPSPYSSQFEHEWIPSFLSAIVGQLRACSLYSNSSNNPILNASSGVQSSTNFGQMSASDITISIRQQLYSHDSPIVRQMNEAPGIRYRFVCDAIYLTATSTYPDLVNDIAVLCADITSKCPSLINDWILALQALCCSAQRDLGYGQLLSKINISEPLVMDNIAIFTAILVARRCLELDEFIIKCAIGAILAPLGSIDRQLTEPGVRLTCHLLLTLFRNRETPFSQSRSGQTSLMNAHNTFGQSAFPNYGGNSTPNYGGLLGSIPSMSLLQTVNIDNDSSSDSPLALKYLCDHHLLRSACCNIKTECHITLLKAIRVLAMWASPTNEPELAGKVKIENTFDEMSMDGLGYMRKDPENDDGSQSLMTSDSNCNIKNTNLQTASLHQFADAILRLLCSQRWLHDKCLFDSEIFTTTDTDKNILIDPRIDVKQSQRLLYMICYNKSPEKQADVGLDDQGSDQVASIVKMFENLDVWSMRLSLMRLQFMFAYCKSQSNSMLNDWLDNLAKAVVEFFQKSSQENESIEKGSDDSNECFNVTKTMNGSPSVTNSITNINKVWLIEPLLDKLTKPPSFVQSRIIKASAALMESASVRANSLPSLNQTYLSTAAASTKFKERTLSQRGSASTNPSNLASTSLLGFQPFLSLLLSCLRNQDRERDTLLTSLNSQLYQAIHEKVDDIGYKQSLQDGLELRLCLIGQMFDTIQKSASLTSDWATLLLLLIMNNLVDPQVDYGLYVSVLDMLAMLIHSAYASDPLEQKEEAKKQYQNLMKKFRKELAALEEKGFIQMKLINPLMPLVRQMTEVITCEPMGSLVDTKGEKVENFYSIDKKKGLKVSELQEVSPWDLIEGHKNPAPLSWPWFGAVRLEQKPLRVDENNRLMSWHTHTIRHSTAYFCQTPAIDEGPSSAKRSNTEKKPSQSNPLLKSLIEANDEGSPWAKREHESGSQSTDDSAMCIDPPDEHYIGREDLLEDYCELPIDLLFDSTPIETMIENIKTAIQAEHAAMSNRAKPPIVDSKSLLNNSQASSLLAPVQSDSSRSTTPQVSALNALQNHLNASGTTESSVPITAPGNVPPPPSSMSPVVNIRTPELIPRPPSNIPKITPTPPPSLANRSLSPMVVARSPAISATPPPKPKAPRRKRATKKDTNPVIDANANIPNSNIIKNPNQMSMISSSVPSYPNNLEAMNHANQPMVVNQAKMAQNSQPSQMPMHQIQQPSQGMIVRRSPITQQQQQIQQQQPQQPSVYDFQYQSQPQQSNQFVPNNYYEQQNSGNNLFNQPQQPPIQMGMQSQHPLQAQHQMQGQAQQHMQQHQHHQIQYQSGQHHHGPDQQHMQSQQVRLSGHQHQQPMPFQQIQQHQHTQQQIFAPQQAAGHSRPALTAMLHQKHAAAGNMDNKMHPQPRFNYG